MRRPVLAALLLGAASLHADELSFQILPQARIEYEGTGFREVPSGWELKVKPWTPAGGLRWRRQFAPAWAGQAQFWMNRAAYGNEDGNSESGTLRQTGQTSQAIAALWLDARTPLAGSPVEIVAGLHGLRQSFRRKDIVFHNVVETQTAHEVHHAVGAHIGFHRGTAPARAEKLTFFWDGELLLGHLFYAHNTQRADGSSVGRGGYTYSLRLEAGAALGAARLSLGYARQLYEVTVRGGKALPSGAAASLPINKTDLFGPFVALGWTF